MAIRNETLRKKLESKRDFLVDKITPLQEELDLVTGMLKQMDDYESKTHHTAEKVLGLSGEAA